MTIYETDTDLYATYTGSAWLYVGGFQDFTLTFSSGYALGNGTSVGRYARVGDFIFGYVQITFGSTSTFGASIFEIDLPVNRDGDFQAYLGVGQAQDTGAGNGYGLFVAEVGNKFRFQSQATSLSHTTDASVTNTIPFTWNGSDGDRLGFSFFYKAA
jgi:hypothetical protein